MRGINTSSIFFVVLIIWNIATISFLIYRKNKLSKHRNYTHHRLQYILSYLLINIILIIGLIYISSTIGVTHYSIKSSRIPSEFDGFKIMQISDFHNGSFKGGTKKLIERVEKEKPDIIALTGDIIDEKALNDLPVAELVSKLKLFAPVYFVSGNHDINYPHFYDMYNMLKNEGVVLLENQKVIIKKGMAQINLYGIDDLVMPSNFGEKIFLNLEMSELKPQSGYNVLLFHRADFFDNLKGNGYQLVLAGHMHGGQVQIPFVGGLISPHINRRLFPKYTDGIYSEAGTTMVVSRGLGNIVHVPRVLNPPEVVLVTLLHNEN